MYNTVYHSPNTKAHFDIVFCIFLFCNVNFTVKQTYTIRNPAQEIALHHDTMIFLVFLGWDIYPSCLHLVSLRPEIKNMVAIVMTMQVVLTGFEVK